MANDIQHKSSSSSAFVPASLNLDVCEGDSIRAGERSRATIAFITNGVVLTIEQNTEWVVRRPTGQGRSIIELLRGAILFFTREPRSLEVQTPFVNAAVEGTEFLIRVEQDRAVVTVFEGRVALTNPSGTLALEADQSAVAQAGLAPQLQVVVRPRDAVQWALYYEPVLPADSFQQVDQIPETQRDARFYLRRASLLLEVGRLDEARADIAQAIRSNPNDGDAYALLAVVAVALNDREAALANAREAVARSPTTAAARIARSYALQSNFELEAARDELLQAVAEYPGDGRAWARLAELWLSLGYVMRALDAAERAVSLSPDLARTQTVVGFARLAETRLAEAATAFDHAVRLESGAPLARLGAGLTKMRLGDRDGGRRDIELAVALDPDNALLRSYLGKAYFEEKRDALAAREFDRAAGLDAFDPTPLLYSAIQKQSLNRPVEALRDLQSSIDRNDNRAVYRSRLLLDQDLAARGAKLSRIYRDLGFEQLALVEGWKSLDVDPSNHSAHRLLADNYLALPSHQIARDSELLQSQLLQPVNINPVQPRLADNGLNFLDDIGIAAVGHNEFTRLFASNGLRVVGDGLIGTQGTATGNVIVSGIVNRLSFSLGQFYFDSAGIRQNNDISQKISNAFVQGDVSNATSVQVEYRHTHSDEGDRRMLFDPQFFAPNLRATGDVNSVRLGFRQRFTPASTLIASYARRALESDFVVGGFNVVTEDQADALELRYLHRWSHANITAGVGHFSGDGVVDQTFDAEALPPQALETRHTNGYFYATFHVRRDLAVSGGLSGNSMSDTSIGERRQTNPKLGVSWMVTPRTAVRAGVFRVLDRTLINGQTIEPTQVTGFNQFFDDGVGARSWRYGVAADQVVWSGGYAGAEYTVRRLKLPAFSPITQIVVDGSVNERFVRAYFYTTLAGELAFSAEYQRTHFSDPAGDNSLLLEEATTHKVPIQLRFFDQSGVIGRVRATYVKQEGRFRNVDFILFPGRDEFLTVDVSAGYRLPRRMGLFSMDIRNLFDTQFAFQDANPFDATVVPSRQVLARLSLTF